MILKYILNKAEIENAIKLYLETKEFIAVSPIEWIKEDTLVEAVVDVCVGSENGI